MCCGTPPPNGGLSDLDVFQLRNGIVGDYDDYVRGFLKIRDPAIMDKVEGELDSGLLWPDPLIQLSPSFEPGASVDDLVEAGILSAPCKDIFRRDKRPNDAGSVMTLYRHQLEAIEAAKRGDNYVVTTGTGSGKSLTYIVPIVDHVLRNNPGQGRIQAVIVYPMNALANSQIEELKKFLHVHYHGPAVTFERYTGQESKEDRERITENPPDILLTNYVMLELILTRNDEAKIVDHAQDLQFLVLDELHTYRGRQGADVAMLVRRVRESLNAASMRCIGTSATLASEDIGDPKRAVADVAKTIFGDHFDRKNVITETLTRATPMRDYSEPSELAALRSRIAGMPVSSFRDDPLSSWIESELGLDEREGVLVRRVPRPLSGPSGAAARLDALTGLGPVACEAAIKAHLLHAYQQRDRDKTARAFAFRLHQFVTRGGTPYVTLEPPESRFITVKGMPYRGKQPLFPVVFCHECGQDYLTARYSDGRLIPRDPNDRVNPRDKSGVVVHDAGEAVYVYVSTKDPWDAEDMDRFPPNWLEQGKNGLRLKSERRKPKWSPTTDSFNDLGEKDADGMPVALAPLPFRFCLNSECGASWSTRIKSDAAKLLSLDNEARSSSTTILSMSTLAGLREEKLPNYAKKLLSFMDNVQDASLQSGHFNDFIDVGVIRTGLYTALAQYPNGLLPKGLEDLVFDALELEPDDYANQPGLQYALGPYQAAVKDVIRHRIFRDLERGWRITSPNLEQCGLLEFDYEDLAVACADPVIWRNIHGALIDATPAVRENLARAVLDLLRRELCLNEPYLEYNKIRSIRNDSQSRLNEAWAIDDEEDVVQSKFAVPRGGSPGDAKKGRMAIGPMSNFGQFVREHLSTPDQKLTKEDTEHIISDLLECLSRVGLVYREVQDEPVYQLESANMRWIPGTGEHGAVDALRTRKLVSSRTNPFFVGHYKERGLKVRGLESGAHTGLVKNDVKELREKRFRKGSEKAKAPGEQVTEEDALDGLPVLYATPTMELGIDISQLNVVNMRNIPPTPANYAQRSGRAGRSGDPALIITYCSKSSPHDQYFFQHPEKMVQGSVSPPSIDLTNESLVLSHINAIWLKQASLDLGTRLEKVVEIEDNNRFLQLRDSVILELQRESYKEKTYERAQRVLGQLLPELADADWYTDTWLKDAVWGIQSRFEAAVQRWCGLFRAADKQAQENELLERRSSDDDERKRAKYLSAEARTQLNLLRNISENGSEQFGDFYSYRYFAAEGFLPGYNFPRLPLTAFVPGRRGAKANHLNRPRFVAIQEFGPRSILYYEGNTYRIVKANTLPDDNAVGAAKICEECGLLNAVTQREDPDTCKHCQEPLPLAITNLYRMQGVGTQRAKRINSDEEERRRLGFDVRTAIRHAGPDKTRRADIETNATIWGWLTYAPNADVWRINEGERRRANKDERGFLIDEDTGYWAKSTSDEEDEGDRGMVNRTKRVVPFVEDTTNCLTLHCNEELDPATWASLQAALKKAIQVHYHIEDRELAAEPLPSLAKRKGILFYEASSGGAGVLRHLASKPQALQQIAKTALEILHYNEDGTEAEDLSLPDACTRSCYDCLLSYFNQLDHLIVQRSKARDILVDWTGATVHVSSGQNDRGKHLLTLMDACDTDLEREWLAAMEAAGFHLPRKAQGADPNLKTKPDFVYDDPIVFIYVDGPVHDAEDIRRQDEKINQRLERNGVTYLRFRYDEKEQWLDIAARNPRIFGVTQ